MISYDSYQNRIKRIAAIKNFIVRFRLLFIALAILIVATIFTLLGITGIVTKDIVLPSNAVYGDAFTVEEPKALLSDVKYQFRYLGKTQTAEEKQISSVRTSLTAEENESASGEWTYEIPSLAGRYEVRVVTKSGFGGKKYSSPKQFEIESKPVEFIIKADSLTYGSAPSHGNYEFPLVSGDTLIVEDLTFSYDDPSLDVTNICANSASFVIVNSKGEDVTFCYDIATPKKEVSLQEKSITLSLDSVTYEYSGKPFEYTPALSQSVVSALKGDKAEFDTVITDVNGTVVEAPLNAGTYTVNILPDISFFNGEADVSKHYKIEQSLSSTFTITPRKITVTTKSDGKEYDGTALVNSSFDCDEGLLEDIGHRVTLLSGTSDKKAAGVYENIASFAISDADGKDVTANYEINSVFGTLTINKREITVRTEDREKIYDAQPFSEQNFNGYTLIKEGAEALANNHTQVLSYANTITDAGVAPNGIEITVYDENGVAVTENYNITYVAGTLTVKQREITVTTPSDSWEYDGYPHINSEIDVKLSDGSGASPFADGEELSIIEVTSVTYFTEGAVKNVVSCEIIRSADYSDVTNNYKITTVCGELSITKRAVTITTPTITKVFDGKYLKGNDENSTADNLADADSLVYAEVASILYVGKAKNEIEFKIDNGGASSLSDVTENYEISVEYGELEITKRDITIHTSSPKKTYDGTPLTGDSEEPIIDNFVDGEKIEAYDIAELTLAGAIENTTKYRIILSIAPPLPDSEYDDVEYLSPTSESGYETTENYNITYDNGTITVKQRYVGIATASGSKEYDGTPFVLAEGKEIALPFSQTDADSGEFTANETGLLSGHTLKLDETVPPASVTNVAENEVINAVYFRIFDGDTDVSENYKPLYSFGKISTDKRNVRIITQSGEFIYSDTGYSNPSTYSAHISLADGEWAEDGKPAYVLDHYIKCETPFVTPTDIGEYDNIAVYEVFDGSGENVTSNYDLHMEYGKLKVTPRPLSITVEGGSRVYDDTPYTYVNGTAEIFDAENETGIVSGHEIVHDESKTTAFVTYVTEGQVKNEQYYSVLKDGTDVSQNYDINYEYGYIFVTARPITIKTLSGSKEFDGEAYSLASEDHAEVISSGTLADGHYLKALTYSSVTYVTEGDIDNIVTYAVKKDDVDLTENYEITYDKNYGKISITKRSVFVLTTSCEWTYDGEEHFDYSYADRHLVDGAPDKEDGLVLGHKLNVVDFATVTNCSDTAAENNVCTYTVVTKDGAQDMSDNYLLSVKYGTLSIFRRQIIITTGTQSHTYDGKSFSYTEGWSVVGGLDLNGFQLEKGLVLNHTLKVKLDENGNEIKTYVTDVQYDENGKVTGVPNKVEYEVYDGDVSVDENYDIVDEYKYGVLTVTPRPILIETGSAERIYNGLPLMCVNSTVQESDGDEGLLSGKGHTAELDADYSPSFIIYITKVGDKVVNSKENILSYKIVDNNKKDISKNYAIKYEYGTLTIIPRPLTITTPTLSKPYDGTELCGDSGQPVFDNLATIGEQKESYRVVESTVASIIDVKESGKSNTTEYEIWSVNGKENTTLCYDITRVDGTLSITRIPLTITTITAEKVYDGTPLKGDDEAYGKPVFDGFVEGAENGYNTYYVPKNITSVTDYGTSSNTTEYIIRTYRGDSLTDITDNYGDENGSFIRYDYGTLTVNKRTVKIFVLDAEHEYDGSEFTSTVWKEEEDTPYSLLSEFNHTLKVDSINVGITDVGTVTNDVSYIVVVKDGNSVDNNYNLKIRYGVLTVTPRIIRIITPDDTWTYDAEEHFNDKAECVHLIKGVVDETAKGLVLDHKLETLTYATITNFGDKVNVCTYKIVNEAGDSVTGNYLFDENTYSYGTLSITKRPVTITTAGETHEYDGNAFSKTEGYTVEEFNKDKNRGIVSGHREMLDPNATVPAVTYVHDGEIENALIFIINDENGNPVTGNYEINYVKGKISITPHTVTVTNPTISKIYDGNTLYGYDEEHKPEVNRLILNDKIVVDIIANITDVGTITNSTTYKIFTDDGTVIYDGDGEVKDSYVIDYTAGATLTVTSAKLKITTASFEKVYDGTPLYGDKSKNGDNATVISSLKVERYDAETDSWIEGLFEGELRVDESNLKTLTDVNTETVLNTTKYRIFAQRNGEFADITANYGEIDYSDCGTLTVTVRKIIINTPTDSREFNGKPFTNPNATVSSGDPIILYDLVEGHELKVKEGFAVPSVTYVTDGEVENEIEYDIVDKDGNSVNGNYFVVRSIFGKISITQRQISITTISRKFDYNGKAQGDDRYSATYLSGTGDAIVSGHTVNVEKSFKITNVKENTPENNKMVYKIIDGDGVDRTENYAITDYFGTIEIVRLPVEIVLNKIESFTYGDVFGGYPLVGNKMFTYAVGSATTVDGEELEITVKYQLNDEDVQGPVNAGEYEAVVNDMRIVGGNEDIGNYNISYVASSFTVSPKAITLNLMEVDGKMYDAVAFEFPLSLGSGYEITAGELVEGDTLTIAVNYLQNGQFINNVLYSISEKNVIGNPLYAGAYIAEFDPENCKLDGNKPIANYSITCEVERQSFNITQRPIYFDVKEVKLTYTSLDKYNAPNDMAMPDFDKTLLADGDSLGDVQSGVSNVDGSPISELTVGEYLTSVYTFTVMRSNLNVSSNYYLDNSDPEKNRAKFEIVKRQIRFSVWFIEKDKESSSSSNEYTGKEINLKDLYSAPYGPYKSEVLNDEYNPDFGIGVNDVAKVEAVFTFTQNGNPVTLLERGKYEVDVTLKNKDGCDALKNYDIDYPSNKGEFTVTRRQVIVTPKITKKNIEYNGKALNQLNQEILNYDTAHKFNLSEYGFIAEKDKEDYKATYSLYKIDDTSQNLIDENLIDEILQVGTYKLAVKLAYIGTGEEKYDIVGYNYSAEFAVSPRTIYVKTYNDDNGGIGNYLYDKTAHGDTSEYSFVPYFLDNGVWTTENVFCNDDGDPSVAHPVFSFVHENGSSNQKAVNAGTYTIKVTSFTGVNPVGNVDISKNYQVVDFPREEGDRTYGRLIIRPARVIVVPLPYSEKYSGDNVLYMPDDNYSIEYVEGNGNSLFGGDKIEVTFSSSVKITAGSTVVKISDVKVIYPDTVSEDIRNYDISYSYSQLKSSLPEFVKDYTYDSFIVPLTFERRTLRIAQCAPPEEYKIVEYGSFIKIKISGDYNGYILSGGDGLLDNHTVTINTIFGVADTLGTMKNWLRADAVKITDSSNTNVTNGYDIEIVYEGDGYADRYIEVVERKISVEVNFAPAGIGDNSVINTSAYRVVSGSFISGDKMTVKVIGGKFVAEISDISGTADRSEYYNVTFTYPETANLSEEEAYASWI